MRTLNFVQFTNPKNSALKPDFIFINLPERLDNTGVKYLTDYAVKNKYKKITLPYEDLPWQNRAVLWYHKFRTQPVENPVTVYAKQ